MFNRRQHSLTPATPKRFGKMLRPRSLCCKVFLELFGGHLRQFNGLSLRGFALSLFTGCCRNLLRFSSLMLVLGRLVCCRSSKLLLASLGCHWLFFIGDLHLIGAHFFNVSLNLLSLSRFAQLLNLSILSRGTQYAPVVFQRLARDLIHLARQVVRRYGTVATHFGPVVTTRSRRQLIKHLAECPPRLDNNLDHLPWVDKRQIQIWINASLK
ncbi:MAG TPA: hypothetical protein PK472_17000 [Pseudomonadota bacterium]|nr:hypothetical protein [Pseudomonadota bacterium]